MHSDFTSAEAELIKDVKQGIHEYVESKMAQFESFERGADLKNFIRDNFVVSGGISASMFTRTAVKDVDLYYHTTVDVTDLNFLLKRDFIETTGVFHHFVKKINPSYMVGEVAGKLITVNAITLNNDMQLIRLAGVKECQAIFDFKHCLPIYDIKNNVYKISRNAFDSLTTKTLMTHHTPIKDHRISKFQQRGWDFKTVNSP